MSRQPPPFFIVGVPRSGTTLLTVLLNNHPVIFLDERAIAIRTLDFRQRVARIRSRSGADTAPEIWRRAAAPDSRLREFLNWDRLERHSGSLGEFVGASFHDRAVEHGKSIFGDKSPDAITRLPELLSLFPQARIIHVVRDARPNVASLVRRQYLDRKVAAQEWKDWNVLGVAAAEWQGTARFHRLRYEDLLADPEQTLGAVCAFLGVPYTPAMLDLAGAK
ncbi:MAG: sulfotransferase, partial [Bacteroidota bacterium]